MYKVIKANNGTEPEVYSDPDESDLSEYPLTARLKRLCARRGYYLYRCESYREGVLILSINNNNDTFLPEIYYDSASARTKQPGKFRIQTTSYGALELGEYEEFLHDCNEAFELVKEMEEAIEEIGIVPGETVERYEDEI